MLDHLAKTKDLLTRKLLNGFFDFLQGAHGSKISELRLISRMVFATPATRVRDKKVILDMKWSEVGPKEGRNVSAHADDEPIRGPKGLVIVISSSRRTRFAAP